jgi:hypothetical protein
MNNTISTIVDDDNKFFKTQARPFRNTSEQAHDVSRRQRAEHPVQRALQGQTPLGDLVIW